MPGVVALVLAGGRGTRLNALTTRRAKPAVPFSGDLRIIDFTLSNCMNSGVTRIGVLTQYQAQTLIPHLTDIWAPFATHHQRGLDVLAAPEDGIGYQGTADAVQRNRAWLLEHRPAQVLILAGDHVYNMDYAAMVADHRRHGAQLTVGCVEVPLKDASAFGVMEVGADNRILSFEEKPSKPRPLPGHGDTALASMGIYVFDTAYLLDQLDTDAANADSTHDFGRDVVPSVVSQHGAYAHPLRDPCAPGRPGYWRDVGTVDAYWRCNLDVLEMDTQDPFLGGAAWPLWNGSETPSKLSGTESVCESADVVRCGLSRDVRIGPDSRVCDSVLLPGSIVGAGCVVQHAVVEDGCQIPAGTLIGVDAALDRSRFHVTPGGVVLVTAKDLQRAALAA